MAEENTARPVTIGIVAGEASGDALGAELIHAVRQRIPGVRFAGIGGPRMESAGCAIWYPMSRLALRGYAEVLTHLPGLVRVRRELYRRLRSIQAALFIGALRPDAILDGISQARRLLRGSIRARPRW